MARLSFYDNQRAGKIIFLAISLSAVVAVMLISNNLVKALAQQERERMNIWAKATERLAKADVDSDFEFLLSIIEQNNSIPVMVADDDFNIIEFRNFNLPEHQPEAAPDSSNYPNATDAICSSALRLREATRPCI